MHRGSSKGARRDRAPETLPLSAPLPLADPLVVEVEIARARRSDRRTVELPRGATVRDLLRAIGQSSEGCAVLDGDRPLPADEPIASDRRLVVVPTFSGG